MSESSRHMGWPLVVVLVCLIVYHANGRAITAGDTYPARYMPFSIWHDHTLTLDPVEKLASQGRSPVYWIRHLPDGHAVSLYPVTLPLLISPLYAPAVAYLDREGWTVQRLDRVARVMEKVSAALIAALSAAFVFVALRRRTSTGNALLLTLAYAFGTTTWMISSQALWQHGLGQLLVASCLVVLSGASSGVRALVVGLLCGLIVSNRPPDVLIAVPLAIYALSWAGRGRLTLFVLAGLLPVVLVLAYNLEIVGHFAGAYALLVKRRATFFTHGLIEGIAGNLFSPVRGLLVFSPFLLFLAMRWRYWSATRGARGLDLAIAVGAALQLMLYAKSDWRAGVSFGPRFLTDLLPLLVWLLVPVIDALRGAARALFALAVGWSVVVQAIGAVFYTGVTDAPLYDVPPGPDETKMAWSFAVAPYVAALAHGPAPSELATEITGSFDKFEAGGVYTDTVSSDGEVAALGWALADHATPAQVAVMVDGQAAVGTRSFVVRADVAEATGEKQPGGWRITFSTKGLAPGEHRVTALAWKHEKGEGRYFAERVLTVQPVNVREQLADAAKVASARIREHQREDGSWLTAHTKQTRFENPGKEMNTFLTALMIDLVAGLNPSRGDSDLRESLNKAREHLRKQIEGNGLVRYHGLPSAPGIGSLGCVITPDTDDTALVWRIAPSPDIKRLHLALATIDRYRTNEGLYRSWLAPIEQYQCLNPGSDPNPTDVAIQMHLFMLLAKERPASARALCEALKRTIDEDRIWVYYRKAALVPMYRLRDMRNAGCEITLPAARMTTSIDGQDVWIAVVEALQGRMPATRAEELLRTLSANDFSLLRVDPPMLFHNDLSASVSRYYWSEDIGYALWLRLYEATL